MFDATTFGIPLWSSWFKRDIGHYIGFQSAETELYINNAENRTISWLQSIYISSSYVLDNLNHVNPHCCHLYQRILEFENHEYITWDLKAKQLRPRNRKTDVHAFVSTSIVYIWSRRNLKTEFHRKLNGKKDTINSGIIAFNIMLLRLSWDS